MLENVTKSLQLKDSTDKFCTSLDLPANGLKIAIKNFGNITEKISQQTARALIKEARLASFGWRDQTVIDTRVRNVWELPKSKIKISKKDFQKVFGPALEKIKLDLGLAEEGKLTAELHNLLIYEPGQFFSNHQDSEKSDDMVATMVVLLPCAYKGGSLVIDQQGDKKTFRAKTSSTRGLRVVAFYADCHHEVKKVTQGYRIALTYNLVFKASGHLKQSPSNPGLTQAINQYFAAKSDIREGYRRNHPRWLVYLLDHQYSRKGLDWLQLKGLDRTRTAQLLAAAEHLDLNVHLALSELHETWQTEEEYSDDWGYHSFDDDDEDDDEDYENESQTGGDVNLVDLIDEDYSLAHWMSSDGKKLAFKECTVPKSMFCWTKANDEIQPFKSEHEGYMGNYGNTMDRWYHRAAVVLWPKEDDFPSLFAIDPIKAMSKLKSQLAKNPEIGGHLLEKALPQWEAMRREDPTQIRELLGIAKLVQKKGLATRLLSVFNLQVICPKNISAVLALIEVYGETWMLSLMKTWSESTYSYNNELGGMSKIIKKLNSYKRICKWLLDNQVDLLVSVNQKSEKNRSRVELDRGQKSIVNKTGELLLSAHIASDKKMTTGLIEHILQSKRVYSSLGLAQLAAKISQYPDQNSLWDKLVAEARKRLTAELSKKRKKNDYSILDAVPCSCSDCKDLSNFLKGKDQKTLVWPLARARRQHIHSIIDGMGLGVSHVTQRIGSPQKLVLTKLKKHFEKETALRKEASNILEKITRIDLKK